MVDLKRGFNRIGIYPLMAFILAVYFVISFFRYGVSIIPQVLIAVATAFVLDHLIIYAEEKRFRLHTSPIISGLFIGLILDPSNLLYIPLAAAVFAILSKHVLRFGKQIFNPATFGIILVYFIFGAEIGWVGAFSIIAIALGSILLHVKFKRFHLVLSFLITFFIISLVYSVFWGNASTALFLNYPLYFMASFMLVEPKTSPISRNARIYYGFFAAIVIFLGGIVFPEAILLGLLISNLFVPLFNRIK